MTDDPYLDLVELFLGDAKGETGEVDPVGVATLNGGPRLKIAGPAGSAVAGSSARAGVGAGSGSPIVGGGGIRSGPASGQSAGGRAGESMGVAAGSLGRRADVPSWRGGSVVEVEGIVVGHLPVRAGLWVRQHARSVAHALGRAVGLVTLRTGFVAVDVFGGPKRAAGPRAASASAAIAALRGQVDRVLVHVDEVDEAALCRHGAVDRISVLTGADEASVVHTYRLLKGIVQDLAQDGSRLSDPELSLVVLAATDARWSVARDKLTAAARTFLGRSIACVRGSSTIDGGVPTELYAGEHEGAMEAVLSALRAEAQRAEGQRADARADGARSEAGRSESGRSEGLSGGASRLEAKPRGLDVGAGDESGWRGPGDATAALARHLGLVATDLTSPRHPSVLLAIDARGVLHLLAESEATDTNLKAVARVLAAMRWAKEHLELLGRADGRIARAEPVAHLATGEVSAVREMIDLPVQVHVVRSSPGGGEPVVLSLSDQLAE